MPRAASFVAARIGRASPCPSSNRPCLRRNLTRRSPHRHGVNTPSRHTARSPQVRTHSFTSGPSDLRRHPLMTRASRLLACSSWSAAPSSRFLFIGPPLRSTLAPHSRSPSCSTFHFARFDQLATELSPRVRPVRGAKKRRGFPPPLPLWGFSRDQRRGLSTPCFEVLGSDS